MFLTRLCRQVECAVCSRDIFMHEICFIIKPLCAERTTECYSRATYSVCASWLFLLDRFSVGLLSCRRHFAFCSQCKIVSLSVSAFTGAALNICDCAADGDRMTLGARYISVRVSSSDSHCLTTIYQMHSIRHL